MDKTVPELRPERTDPSSSSRPPWQPADPCRWAILNLADPDLGDLVPDETVADVLAWGLVTPGAEDPVEGILDGVRFELLAVCELMGDSVIAVLLGQLERRIQVASQLLRYTDERVRMPLEPDEEPTAAPAGPLTGEGVQGPDES